MKFKESDFGWPNGQSHPKRLLQFHHGSIQNAARIMKMDHYKLSRILNGAEQNSPGL